MSGVHAQMSDPVGEGPAATRFMHGAWRAATLAAAVLALLAWPDALRADGNQGPPPQAPPPQLPADADEDGDAPRRDVRMGTRDNMSMGRDKEGNLVMEVSPRPRKPQDTPNMPMYITPQIYTGYGPYTGQGQTAGQGVQGQFVGQGQGQSTGQSQGQGVQGPSAGQGQGVQGQPMQGSQAQPIGQGAKGQPVGQPGASTGHAAPPMVQSPQGAGPQGVIPAPPGPSRGGPPGQ
ncbi:hypothetical protein G3N56_13155 [Desulfovibrio sulfodismutans]|uniref:Uncharacterized protein n=1 Tax=Desulfolutivibrio sulfodismutans TaxID=63561 RepID=A0A7K3NNB6_9BACT|nr:hypothetical protein [Desulfolutivibrio sulfodismutans]NDY57678.1 hypothetical protein [Desulfolutivibrio sulfodismutans]QLA12270.1 hypothetical protein GD606_08280 [Desulfolutivibrio sulfodismutans DSM 3696]